MMFQTELPGAYVLRGDAIYTMDDDRPRADAVGVVDGRIVATGSEAEVMAAMPRRCPRIDVESRTVLPGFTDGHTHFGYLVRKWDAIDLADCGHVDEVLARVQAYAAARPDVAWFDGHGWNSTTLARGVSDIRERLDRIVPQRPVALSSKDGHALWANSAALAAADIGADTPDPPGGVIVRDEATGAATGLLYEQAAKKVLRALPEPDADVLAADMAARVHRLHAEGITAVHCPETMTEWDAFRRWHEADAPLHRRLRVTFMPPVAMLDDFIAAGMRGGFGDEWLRLGQVKIFADGTLGSRTAAMLEPFAGEPDNYGVTVTEPDELDALARRATANGFGVAIHAIGDRAVRNAITALERAPRPERNAGGGPHRIEHVQLMHPDDVGRLARAGIVASMQPLHLPPDRANAERYWGRRAAYAFAFRSLHDAGVTLSFGSDAPFGLDLTAASYSILGGVHAAVTRTGVDDGPEVAPWYAEQKLTLDEALYAYTLGAARAGGEERWRGSLTPGKVADIVVLDDNLHRVAPTGIPHVRVAATIVAGQVAYAATPRRDRNGASDRGR